MRHVRRGRDVLLRLDPGEEVHTSLREFARDRGLGAAAITSGIGQVRDVLVGFLCEDGTYDTAPAPEVVELLSLQGNISLSEDGAPLTHLHVTLSDAEHRVHGGHLVTATVNVVAELHLRILNERGDGASPMTRHPVVDSEMMALRLDGE